MALVALAGIYLASLAAPLPAFAAETQSQQQSSHKKTTTHKKTAAKKAPVKKAPASKTAATHKKTTAHKKTAARTRKAAPVAEYTGPSTGFGPTAPGVSSIVINASTGQVVGSQSADTPRYPASLTKLMTLDLAFQALAAGRMTLDTQIPISAHASAVEPVKLGLRPGDSISVHDAILAMTTMSANDAATALGEYLGGGSEDRAAQMMTLRAHAIGMAQTQFYNASGLPNPNQVTTARDLAMLARDLVINYPQFQSFFEVTSFSFRGRQVYSNNGMLKSYSGATGMKTGYTNLARHNLITSAQRDGKQMIGVVLHEPTWGSAYSQMTAMLDGGFGGHVPMTADMVAQAGRVAKPRVPGQQAPVVTIAANQAGKATALPAASSRAPAPASGWVAQLGLYNRQAPARSAAMKAQHVRGEGVARIARVTHHGQTMWSAQVAGLSYHAAHATCSAMTAKGNSCKVVAPSTDHLAMLTGPDGT